MGINTRRSNSIWGNIGLVIGSFIVMVVVFFGMLILAGIMRAMNLPEHYADGLARIVVAIGVLALFKKLNQHIKLGFCMKGLAKSFLLGWVVWIASVINFYDTWVNIDMSVATIPNLKDYIGYGLYVLGVGVFEEVLLRGIILNKMLDRWGDSKGGIYDAVLISSFLFGLWHLINLINKPWMVIGTITQVFYAFFIGVFFSAVYLRTRNLWSVILMHAIFDIGGCLEELFINEVAQQATQDISVATGLFIILEFSIFMIVGLFYLRKVDDKEPIDDINRYVRVL